MTSATDPPPPPSPPLLTSIATAISITTTTTSSSYRLTLLYPNAQVYYFGEQVLGLLAVEQANFVLKASAPSNIEVVVADAGNIHVLKS